MANYTIQIKAMSVSIYAEEIEVLQKEIRAQLDRILSSPRFTSTERNANFLRYVVETTLEGKAHEIKEVVIATELYGRPSSYDPKVDSIVRVEATRVRSKLRAYYENEGQSDPILITIPKGSYVPQFDRVSAREPNPIPVGPVPVTSAQRDHQPRSLMWIALVTALLASGLWGFSIHKASGTSVHPDALAAWQEANDLIHQDPHTATSEYGAPAILLRALERYEFAVAKEPKFAQGWASLSEAYDYVFPYVGRNASEDAKRAEAAARRAIALDPKLADGYAMLALAQFCLNWDFKGAETTYRRAIELDPRNAYAVVEYADLLRETGRLDQAAAEVRRARAPLPALPVLAVKEAEIQLDQNQVDAGMATATSALQLNRDYRRAYITLGRAWEAKGDYEQALAMYREALQVNSDLRRSLPAYGYLLGVMGRKEEARSVAQQLEDFNRKVRNCAFQVAVVYTGLGEHERALDWLERAYQTRQAHFPFAAVEYRFKPLHKYPRFHIILDRIGLKVTAS